MASFKIYMWRELVGNVCIQVEVIIGACSRSLKMSRELEPTANVCNIQHKEFFLIERQKLCASFLFYCVCFINFVSYLINK